MDYDDDARFFNFAAGLLLGAVIGAGAALLMAPDSGRKTRRRIRRAAGDFAETAQERWDEVTGEVRSRVDEAVQGARRRLNH